LVGTVLERVSAGVDTDEGKGLSKSIRVREERGMAIGPFALEMEESKRGVVDSGGEARVGGTLDIPRLRSGQGRVRFDKAVDWDVAAGND
jgi:hypothetical protein